MCGRQSGELSNNYHVILEGSCLTKVLFARYYMDHDNAWDTLYLLSCCSFLHATTPLVFQLTSYSGENHDPPNRDNGDAGRWTGLSPSKHCRTQRNGNRIPMEPSDTVQVLGAGSRNHIPRGTFLLCPLDSRRTVLTAHSLGNQL
jgi:hypothetical protein